MQALEGSIEKFIKDAKTFSEGVTSLLTGAENWAIHFQNIFSPLSGEFDLIGRHPEAADTLRNVAAYQTVNSELRAALAPELELIQSRIIAPAKELQGIIKQIRKNITKRDHKVYNLAFSLKFRFKKLLTLTAKSSLTMIAIIIHLRNSETRKRKR